MEQREIELINIVRNSENPVQALLTAIGITREVLDSMYDNCNEDE